MEIILMVNVVDLMRCSHLLVNATMSHILGKELKFQTMENSGQFPGNTRLETAS